MWEHLLVSLKFLDHISCHFCICYFDIVHGKSMTTIEYEYFIRKYYFEELIKQSV